MEDTIVGALSPSYVFRCHKALKELGAPLENWYCVYVNDFGDDSFKCELCGCNQVRYIHIMAHKEYEKTICVGCICAGIMEGDILAAKERDEKAKRRSQRKSHYLKKKWSETDEDVWAVKYKKRTIRISRNYFYGREFFKIDMDGEQYQWKDNRRMTSFLTAQHYVFDIVEMEENYAGT